MSILPALADHYNYGHDYDNDRDFDTQKQPVLLE